MDFQLMDNLNMTA